MALDDQIGALAELLMEMQSRMDQNHDSLMKTMEATTSALQDLCGKSPATSTAESKSSATPSELSDNRNPPVSTDSNVCILFGVDDGDVYRLNRLPDSLLHDIVARLPIKDAGRTAVLSHRWIPIWRAAPLLVGHAYIAVNSDRFYSIMPRSPVGLLEQIHLQQQGCAHPLLVNNNPGSCRPASDAGGHEASDTCITLVQVMHIRCSTLRLYWYACIPMMLDTPKQYFIKSHTSMVVKYCYLFGFCIHTFRSVPWPPWVFARVFKIWVLLVSPRSLLRPPDTSSSSSMSCIDSSCTLTFDPRILLLFTSIVMSMRLLDNSIHTSNGSCALLLKASTSSTTASEGISFLVCSLSALNLSDYCQDSMLTLAIARTLTTATSVSDYFSISHVRSIGVDWLSFNTSASDTCEVFEDWKPPCVSYLYRNIASHYPASSFVMVFLSINIAEANRKCMVYISGVVVLDFWWPVVLFQSCHDAILFEYEACCKLSCEWIITPKLFYSTAGYERVGFSFEENCQAMQGNTVAKVLETPRLLMPLWPPPNFSMILLHFCVSSLSVQPMSMLMGKYFHWKFWEWKCREHWDIDDLQVPIDNILYSTCELPGLNPNISTIIVQENSSKLGPSSAEENMPRKRQELSGVLWTNIIKDQRVTLWDPGGSLHNLQVKVLDLDIFCVHATIQIKWCNFSECAQPVFRIHVEASQINTTCWHGLPLTTNGAFRVSFNIRKKHVP